jgi:Family of unknown function (DUF6529)
MAQVETAPPSLTRSARWLGVLVVTGALVALTVGLVARAEAAPPYTYPSGLRLFFSDSIHLKAWFATAAVALAVGQLFTAAWIFRRLPWRRPAWIPVVHRWTGRLLFFVTLPVAYHCIFRLGFQKTDGRVIAHSFLGCAFYGAFATKVLAVRLHRFPPWVLAAAGGIVFSLLIGLWYTSAFWLFNTLGVSF